MNDRIEEHIHLDAPVSRVWRAVADHREFGEWFRVHLEQPFVAGHASTGHITYPGYEHVRWNAMVRDMQPERLFSLTWHPYAIDPAIDYSAETPTLVEFRLEPERGGTRLTLVESGFEQLPAHRREEAFRMNSGGWAEQMRNIRDYLARRP